VTWDRNPKAVAEDLRHEWTGYGTQIRKTLKLLHRRVQIASQYAELTLIPFGCVHADDPGFSESTWAQCIQEIKETPDCLAVGLGDYKNFLRGTARKHLRSYVADEDSWRDLDQMVRREAEKFAEQWLKPIRAKLIGLSEGNHYHQFQDGTTDTQHICRMLGIPYLEKACFLRLQVVDKRGHGTGALKLLLHHGDWSGGYTRPGGDVNAAELKALGFDADIMIFSHTHRLWGIHIPQLTIPIRGDLHLVERPRAFIRTGCFVRGYVEGCTSYVSKKLLNPTAIGYARLTVKWGRKFEKDRYRALRKDGLRPRLASRGAYQGRFHSFEVRY
jgi:hypothetical protein